MAFEVSLTKEIRANREFVFDWWTDLSSQDSGLVKPLKSRTVLSKTPQLILLHDEEEMYFKKMVFDVKVTLHRPEKWLAEYDGKVAHARSQYTLREEGRNTVLSYHTKVEPSGSLTNVLSPIVKLFVKRVFASEMETFIKALEEDYAKHKAQQDRVA